MHSHPLNVVTWNINLFTASASTLDPLDVLSKKTGPPDIVTLQEVPLHQAEAIRSRLHDSGYETVYSGDPDGSEKRYGNIVAARTRPTLTDPVAFGLPYPQLVVCALVEAPDGPVNVITAHVPNGSNNGWKKIDTLEALKRMVLALKGRPLILTGDFNEPRYARQDGQVVTWGQEKAGERWAIWDGQWTDEDGVTDVWGRWDTAVRWFFESPKESGIRNAFWDVAGHGAMEASHFSRGAPRWFDHVFVSDDFEVDACDYVHAFREDGFSDHSALKASLTLAPRS